MSRHDEALLRIYLSAMPLGKYHAKGDYPDTLFRDGQPMASIQTFDFGSKDSPGLIAALVHLLNAREQTEIPR